MVAYGQMCYSPWEISGIYLIQRDLLFTGITEWHTSSAPGVVGMVQLLRLSRQEKRCFPSPSLGLKDRPLGPRDRDSEGVELSLAGEMAQYNPKHVSPFLSEAESFPSTKCHLYSQHPASETLRCPMVSSWVFGCAKLTSGFLQFPKVGAGVWWTSAPLWNTLLLRGKRPFCLPMTDWWFWSVIPCSTLSGPLTSGLCHWILHTCMHFFTCCLCLGECLWSLDCSKHQLSISNLAVLVAVKYRIFLSLISFWFT